MNIKEAQNLSVEKLESIDGINVNYEVGVIVSYVLKKEIEYIFSHPEVNLNSAQITMLHQVLEKRQKNIPLAYLTGYKYFYGYKFLVNKYTLIPRPETEILVDEVINTVNSLPDKSKNIEIVDIGTGSGCIIISLARQLDTKTAAGKFNFSATDISKKALSVAFENAKINNVSEFINFYKGDLLKPFIYSQSARLNSEKKPILFILANLPYLTKSIYKNSLSIQNEPKKALLAKKGGLKYYIKLLKQINKYTSGKKLLIYLFCEINPEQAGEFKKIINNISSFKVMDIKKDLRGLDRLVMMSNNRQI